MVLCVFGSVKKIYVLQHVLILINIVSLNLITEANRVCEQQLRVAAILRFHVLVIQLSRIRLFSHRYWSLFSQSVVRSIYRSFTVDWFSVQNINNSFVLYKCTNYGKGSSFTEALSLHGSIY